MDKVRTTGMTKIYLGEEYADPNRNKSLLENVDDNSEFKNMILSYIANKHELTKITIDDVIAECQREFPELPLVMVEDSWIRGYQAALVEMEEFEANLKAQLNKQNVD